jgi:ATP-dependent exoDNAse (exonuclease V) beta subunit
LDAGPAMTTQPFPQMDRNEFKLAKHRAATFVRKFNPSGYGEEIDRAPADGIYERASLITVARSTADTPATLYGRWWHDFVQRISWNEETSWKKTFDEHQVTSPAPQRSESEWGLFLQCLKNDPNFSEILTGTELVAYQEMPFFWRMDESRCLEGIVDLALFEPRARKCFILDWKTNRITPGEIDVLRMKCRPQIAAYWKVIAEMTSVSVDAGLYSTSTGRFIVYNADELAAEWERLRKLPPENFTREIAPNLEEPL